MQNFCFPYPCPYFFVPSMPPPPVFPFISTQVPNQHSEEKS